MSIVSHFNKVNSAYYKTPFYSEEYSAQQAQKVIDALGITNTSTLLDVGGGNGLFIRLLKQKSKNTMKWVLSEPSISMLDLTTQIEGIEKINQDAWTVLSREATYDFIIFKEVVHLIPQFSELLKVAYLRLNQKGKILIMSHTYESPYPYFEKVKVLWKKSATNPKQLQKELQGAKFKFQSKMLQKQFKLQKEVWYAFLRNKIHSILSYFTNEQIQQGINEIDQKYQNDPIQASNDRLVNPFEFDSRLLPILSYCLGSPIQAVQGVVCMLPINRIKDQWVANESRNILSE